MAVVTSDPEGKIALSYDVIGNRIQVADEDGDTVQTMILLPCLAG
jgi:YD repeat-containing protein